MKAYISGQISGLEPRIVQIYFAVAEAYLTSKGYKVVNPLKVAPYNPKWTWEQYMIKNIKALFGCDTIYMLFNWEKSRGACIEHEIAVQCKKTIIYEINEH